MKNKQKTCLAAMLLVISFMTGGAFAQKDGNQPVAANTAPNQKSVEERLVQMAYDKMSILDTAERIRKDRKDKKKVLSATLDKPVLKFKLSDFRVGDVSEIMNLKYRDLVSAPTGEVLAVMTIETKDGDSAESKISVSTRWQPGQYSSGADSKWTIGDVFGIEAVRFHDVGRYASYEVRLTFEGKTRTYRALALFHNRNRSDENLNPEILDSISGAGGVLTTVLKDKRLPVGAKRQRTQPLGEQSAAEQIENASYQKGEGGISGNEQTANLIIGNSTCLEWDYNPFWYWELYGNPFHAECLVWDIFFPVIDPPVNGGGNPQQCPYLSSPLSYPQDYETDNQNHASGNHGARTQFKSKCEQLSGCQTNCEVNVEHSGHWEHGDTTENLYYHAGGSNSTRRTGTGSRNTAVTCETAVGYSFKRCLIDCGVSVTLGITGAGGSASVTVSGGDLRSFGHIKGRTCMNGQ